MPLYDDEILSSNSVASLPASTETAPELGTPGFIETSKAFFALENPIFGATKELLLPGMSNLEDKNLRPIDKLQSERPDLLEHVHNFVNVKNEDEYNRKVMNIDYENDQRAILQRAPILTQMAAGLTEAMIDPITLIPLFKAYKTANTVGRTLKGAATGLAYGAGTGLVQEAALLATSETRTNEESLNNIMISTIAGGVFGAGVSAFSKPVTHDAAKILLGDATNLNNIKFIVEDPNADTFLDGVLRQEAIEVEANKLNKVLVPGSEIDTKAVVALPGNATIRIALDNIAQAKIDKGLSPVTTSKGFKEGIIDENGKFVEGKIFNDTGNFLPTEGSKISDGLIIEPGTPTKQFTETPTEPTTPLSIDRSAGAMEVKDMSAENLGLAHLNENLAAFISGPEFLRAPEVRAILSKSGSVKKLGAVFYDSNFIRKGNAEGIAYKYNAEKEIFRNHQHDIATIKQVDELYTKYTGHGQILSTLELTRGKDKVSYREFSRRLFSNLTDENRIDDIPEINQATKPIRTAMDNRVKELMEADILKSDIDPKFMRNYMSRSFNHDVLSQPAKQEKLTTIVSDWLESHNWDATPRTVKLEGNEAERMAGEYVDSIRGETDSAVAMQGIMENFISKGKFLKERHLLIPDNLIQEFLNDDAISGFNSYMTRTSKLLAAQKSLKEAGFDSIQDAQKAIRDDANKVLVGLTDEAEIAKVAREFKDQEKLALQMYRSVLGQLRKPSWLDKASYAAMNYQYQRLGGGMLLSSLQEVFMPIFRKGVIPTLRDGWLPYVRDFNATKLAKHEWQDVAGTLELQNSGLLRSVSGLEDDQLILKDMSKFDIVNQGLTKLMGKASGLADWTDFGAGNAVRITSAGLTRKLLKGVKDSDIEMLASQGLSKDMIPRVTAQLKQFSKKLHGSYISNFNLWTDKEALMVFKNAVQTDTTSIMIRPGLGTQPFFVQESNVARVLWQFKSFSQAATSKITISGLQRRDASVLSGVVMLTLAGGFIKMAKDKIAGRDTDYDIETFLANGLSQSGLMGLWMTSALDLGRGLLDPVKRRYEGQNLAGTAMGPSVSQLYQVGDVLGRVSDGNLSDKDIKAGAKMIPFNNLFYMNLLMDKVYGD